MLGGMGVHENAGRGLTEIDSQSWFHSQEVNVMIDSKVCCFFERIWQKLGFG
jgi:hypothetical protein